jgi:hypothetical protein
VKRTAIERGSALLDALIACGLLAVGVLSLAHLFAIAVSLNGSAADATLAALAAARKLEELRSHLSVAPSPPAALDSDTPGFVDYVDRGGLVRGAGAGPAAFVRRWSVESVPEDPDTLVIQVRVTSSPFTGPARTRGREVWLVTARTRKGP